MWELLKISLSAVEVKNRLLSWGFSGNYAIRVV
jgi:hypothetical protein